MAGSADVVRTLLKHGADETAEDIYGYTPLMYAYSYKRTDLLKKVLYPHRELELLEAVRCNHVKKVEGILKNESTSFDLKRLVYWEVTKNEDEEDDDVKYTPLIHACENGYEEIAKLLISYNANVNAQTLWKKRSALHYACMDSGHKEIVKLLLSHGADKELVDVDGSTALHYAVSSGNEEVVQYLLNSKANIDAVDDDRATLLHCAVDSRDEKMMDYVLTLYTDVMHKLKQKNKEGLAPLHYAAVAGYAEMVDCLLKKYRDILELQDGDGETALQLAAYQGDKEHEEIVELLLNKGAKVAQSREGDRGIAWIERVSNKRIKKHLYNAAYQGADKAF